MGGKIEKSLGGALPDPRGGAEAGVRRVLRIKSRYSAKKVPDTQANSRYSAKNNVAIHMIAKFLSTFFFYSNMTNIYYSYNKLKILRNYSEKACVLPYYSE